MNLRIRHVLPTAPSPTRQTLTFIFWRSIGIPRGGSSLAHVSGYKGVAHRLSIEIMAVPIGPKSRVSSLVAAVSDGVGEGPERLVYAGAGLRGREELRRTVDRPHPGELFLTHDESLRQVHLVPEEHHRDVADLLADHLDPVVQVVERVLAREVADRDDALGSLEIRIAEQGPETFLAHDVPHHHVERRRGALPDHIDGFLGDLRADGRDVSVVELVLHEPLDQRGLSDRDVPDEADLVLEVDLVSEELDRDLARDAVDALDPVVEVFEGLPPGDVAHREDAARSVEIRLLEQLAEAFLAHDVPDRHVDLEFPRPIGRRGGELLLGHLGPERLDVLVVKVLEHESADERGLANRGLADEANFHFHPLDFHEEPPSNVA